MKDDSHRANRARRLGTIAAEIGIALAAAGVVALLALHPARLLGVFPRYGFVARHLPGRELDGPDPIYMHASYREPAQVDTAAIRRGGGIIGDEATYYFKTGVSNRTSENIAPAAQLFFLPAVRRQRPQLADWILSYRGRGPGSAPQRIYTLDRDLRLARVR